MVLELGRTGIGHGLNRIHLPAHLRSPNRKSTLNTHMTRTELEAAYRVLGGLVGRAVGIPAQKPVRVNTPRARNQYRDKVVQSLQLLHDSLEALTSVGTVGYSGQLAHALIDSGGYFWSKFADDYFSLSESARRFALEKMDIVVVGAVEPIIRLADELSWTFIASEVQVLDWSANRGQRGRIDLLGWNAESITLVDVKTVQNIPAEVRTGDAAQLRKYTRDLRPTAPPRHRFKARALYVDHAGRTETRRVNVRKGGSHD